jgi:oligosaccharide repeat unit polymerase
MLSPDEQFYLYVIGALVVLIPVLNWRKKDPVHFWSPLTMVSIVFFYYAVIGPYFAIVNDNTYYRLIDHRSFFLIGWQSSLLAFMCIVLGFQLVKTPKTGHIKPSISLPIPYHKIGAVLAGITVVGIVGLVGTGGLAAQFDVMNPSSGSNSLLGGGGAFRNYLMHSINLLIGASCFYLLAFYRSKTWLPWLLFIIVFALAVFTRQGFRWRHVTLGMSLLVVFYMLRDKKINPAIFIGLGIVGIMIMGFIQSTRTYGRGLQYDESQQFTNEELIQTGFGESAVFMATGLLVAQTTLSDEFIGFDPVVQSVVMPIPRVLWPEKPSGEYLERIEALYSYEYERAGEGVAVLNFGEYYLMFGFAGLVIGCVLLGLLLKLVWRWFLRHRENPLAVVVYAVFFSYIYVIISRGYLPQVVMLFMFTVFPLYYIFRRHYSKLQISSLKK